MIILLSVSVLINMLLLSKKPARTHETTRFSYVISWINGSNIKNIEWFNKTGGKDVHRIRNNINICKLIDYVSSLAFVSDVVVLINQFDIVNCAGMFTTVSYNEFNLPLTFNSLVIESILHLLPVSDPFIYGNDDEIVLKNDINPYILGNSFIHYIGENWENNHRLEEKMKHLGFNDILGRFSLHHPKLIKKDIWRKMVTELKGEITALRKQIHRDTMLHLNIYFYGIYLYKYSDFLFVRGDKFIIYFNNSFCVIPENIKQYKFLLLSDYGGSFKCDLTIIEDVLLKQ